MAGRYVLGAILLLPLAIKAHIAQGALYKKYTLSIVHLALVGSVLPVGFMTWAQQSIHSSFAGVVASLAPMMALIAGVVLYGLPSRALHWFGVVLGTCGVAVLRWGVDDIGGGLSGVHTNVSGSALGAALFATTCWGLAAQNYRRKFAVAWGYADAEPVGWHVAVACGLIAAAMWAVRQPVKLKA